MEAAQHIEIAIFERQQKLKELEITVVGGRFAVTQFVGDVEGIFGLTVSLAQCIQT